MSSRLPAAERREQLLDAAMTVFSEHGYYGASMNEVAGHAGVTKPVLYQHFPSKRDLYVELVEGVSRKLGDQITDAVRGNTEPRLQAEAALGAYFTFVEQNQREFQLLFGSGAPRADEFGSGSRLVEDHMGDTIAGLLDHRIEADVRLLIGRAIVGMSEGVCHHWLSQDSRPSADSVAKQLAVLLMDGLGGFTR